MSWSPLARASEVLVHRELLGLGEHLAEGLALEVGGELLVVPGGRGLGGKAGGVGHVGSALEVQIGGGNEDHAVDPHLEALLQRAHEAGGAHRAVALADDVLGRRPAVLLVHEGVEEISDRLDVGELAVELVQVFALHHAAEAGADGVDVDDVCDIEDRVRVVLETRGRLLLETVVVIGHVTRAGEAEVHPHRRGAGAAVEREHQRTLAGVGHIVLRVVHVEHLRDHLPVLADRDPAELRRCSSTDTPLKVPVFFTMTGSAGRRSASLPAFWPPPAAGAAGGPPGRGWARTSVV